jgi:hypothetical protein
MRSAGLKAETFNLAQTLVKAAFYVFKFIQQKHQRGALEE